VRIAVAELTLAGLDAAQGDALAVFVGPERPLQGLAGLLDWRLSGAISRVLRAEHYRAATGEQLLLPSGGRLRIPRVFCFGAAEPPADPATYRALLYRALDALLRAGSKAHAAALPPTAPGGPVGVEAARLWLEATLRFPPERQLLFGDAPGLRRDLAAAREAIGAAVEVVPAEHPSPAPRVAPLPGHPPVVR